jgi:hypothetical protein
VEAGAFLRLAYLLGDRKAAYALHSLMEQYGAGHIESIKIDRRASGLYESYAHRRQPSPRPQ